jgi:hypothetical protein
MADKGRGTSRDKKSQDQKGKSRSDSVKDLPVREGKAGNVKGGAEPAGIRRPIDRAEPINE